MRLLFIITKFESFDLFLSDTAVNLAKLGYEVHVLCHSRQDAKNEGRFIYNNYDIHFHYIEFARGYKPLPLLKTSLKIHKKVKEIDPAYVNVHFTSGIFPAVLIGKLRPFTTGTFHGLNHPIEKNGFKRLIYKAIEYFCACRLDKIITINEMDFLFLNKRFSCKTFLLPTKGLGCNLTTFNSSNFSSEFKREFRNSLGIRNEDFVISFVGRFVSFKGFAFVIRTFMRLLEVDKVSSYKLLLIGAVDGSSTTGLNEDENLWFKGHANIIDVGFVFDVQKYLAVTDCLFFPSVKEGVPISVTEALAMLVPTISVKARGNSDLIINNVNGVLLNDNINIDKAIEAILKVKDDIVFRSSLIDEMKKSRSNLDRLNYVNYETAQYVNDAI